MRATLDLAREFPIINQWIHLDHAGVSPPCARASAALSAYAAEASAHSDIRINWYDRAEVVRHSAARLLRCTPDEIAFVKNTSEGIAFVANGLAWEAGDEIIGIDAEYPANVYPWLDACERHGLRYVRVPEVAGRIDPDAIFDATTNRTRLIALSHVEYASGFVNDLATIGAFCRERGILLCVDAIQSLGVLPVDVHAMNVDFLSADGYKWLLAAEGCGIFYCRRELIYRLRPEIGWMNFVDAEECASGEALLRHDARRFECGSYNIPGVLALGASLELILEIGIPAIREKVLRLTTNLVERLRDTGYVVFSSRRPGEASGIVSFKPQDPAADIHEIARTLREQRIVLAVRKGRLRASPHFYNTQEQIEQLISLLPDGSRVAQHSVA